MTLLRRAPREVYRVYDEEEFFARADRDECFGSTGASGEPRLRRVAGVTVLLAAAGAVGGLIAITSLSAATGARRRVGARRLATTGPPASARAASARAAAAHVWRASPSVDVLGRPSVRGQDLAQAAGRVVLVHHGGTPRRAAALQRAPVSEGSPEPAVREQSTPVAEATTAQPVSSVASASATAQRAGQSEFGFER
jgi:hypothetical protein